MKAITICQPFAELICRADPREGYPVHWKKVENRTWPTKYRGPLAIHAGKSRNWLEPWTNEDGVQVDYSYGVEIKAMPFGAVVAVADLVGCLQAVTIRQNGTPELRRWPWLQGHEHVEGPWCWVLDNVRRLEKPVPYRGAQGLWEFPDELLAAEFRPA